MVDVRPSWGFGLGNRFVDHILSSDTGGLGQPHKKFENGITKLHDHVEEQFKKEMKEAAPYLNNMPRFSLCECSCKEKSDELIDTNKKES